MNNSQSISASNDWSDTRFDSKIKTLRYLASKVLQALESLAESTTTPETEMKLSDQVRMFEADLIRMALQKANGNQREAAELLSLKCTTLNEKIKRYGITVVRPHQANSSAFSLAVKYDKAESNPCSKIDLFTLD